VAKAQERLEKKTTGRGSTSMEWLEVKKVPVRKDIAQYGARKIFSIVQKHLHIGREKAKTAFFEELGYIMVP